MATERPRIASALLLAGATLAVAAALGGVYGAAHLRSRVIENSTPNALNTAYLEAWLRSTPTDPIYLKALGEQYLGLGRLDDAQSVAVRLAALGTPAGRQASDHLLLRCELLRAFMAKPDSSERATHVAQARALLTAMIPGTWTPAQLQWLATQALAINVPDIAARYDERLVAADPARRLHWQREAARQYLATAAFREAASAYFTAQSMAATREEARRDFIAAVGALQAGNLLDEALTQGNAHLGALSQDRATLEVMLALARAANRPELVERYARALMQFVSQRAPGAGAMRLAAAHADSASQRGKWLRLAGFEPFRHAARMRAHRASGEIVEAGYAAGQPVRLLQVAAAAPDPAPSPRDAQADDKLALTLYQSFLEANDLANAEAIAAKQAGRPGAAPEWRKRLAQVQEWRNEPTAALQSWLAYAQVSGDPDAWHNVQRIAPMLNDDEAYVQSLVHASDAAPDNLSLVDDVIAAYERLGRPDDGLAFLKARAHGTRTEEMLRRYAWLSQRSGHFDQALATYEALQQAQPRNTGYAERSANLLYQRGEYAQALAALKRTQPYAGDADTLYWRTYGQLARLLQDDADANLAYRHLLVSPGAEPEDFAAMTFFYDPYPIDAARTATRQYRKTGEVQPLRDAINYFVAAHSLDEAGRLLDSLTPARREAAERNPGFLAARAEYERQSGKLEAALADLGRAVNFPGTSTDTRAAYLWMVVDIGTEDELRAALRRWRDRSLDDETLWGPYAAGEMQLNRPEAALRYLRRQAVTNSRDPLWLLTYADAQEMAGHVARAWSVRRQVWLALLHEAPQTPPTPQAAKPGARRLATPARNEWEATDQLQGRRAQLAQVLANGDYAAHLLAALTAAKAPPPDDASGRSLLGAAPGVAPPPAPAGREAQYRRLRLAVARDVAVAWALSNEHNEVAKRWLARRYAHGLASERNEQLTIALAEEDARQVAQILDTRSASLSLYSRIDGESFVDRQGAAQAHAFEGLDGAPYDDQMHERLVDTSLFWDQSVGASVENYVEHPLDYVQQTVSASLKLADHYLAGLQAVQRFQRSSDTTQLVNVDSVDREASLFVRRQTRDSVVNAAFGRRDGLDSFYTFRLDATTGNASPLTLTGSIARNARSDETQTLFVGGVKDLAVGSLLWQIDPRWSLSASVEADRFYSQARNLLGTGVVQQAELDYKIRTDYPDYTLRFVAAHGGYNDSGQPDALLRRLVPADAGPVSAATFMPNSYTQFGAYVGFGNDLAQRYTHAWRPYLDVGLVHDTVQGWGVNAAVGIAGSVFGGDHAAIYFEHAHVAQNGSQLTMIGARYRWLY
ncbi:tetratricopeptide repeat protein [Paraburkholderia silvatlantica]|uniref:tetratricopeptide repeat protein n=1 Tax=Paraburkholderia silvatlantica TaxID=321895 RepID=UPI0037521FEF